MTSPLPHRAVAPRMAPEGAAPLVTPFDEQVPDRARPTTALAAALSAAAIAVAAIVFGPGRGASAVVLLVLGVTLALTWCRLVLAPGQRAGRVILLVAAVLIPALAGLGDGSLPLRWVPVVVACGLLGGFLVQLARGLRRTRVTDGVAAVVAGLALLASAAVLLVAVGASPVLVAIGEAGTIVAVIVETALGFSPRARSFVMVGVLGASVLAGLGLALVCGVSAVLGAGVALLTATVGGSLRRVLGTLPTSGTLVGGVAEGVASVLVTGAVTASFVVLLT